MAVGSKFGDRMKTLTTRHVLILHATITRDAWLPRPRSAMWEVKNLWSDTVPGRLNAPVVLWRLESIAGLFSTRLTSAVYCSLRWWFRTFEIGILAMWMMENVHYLSGHLLLAELSPCRKCHGILSPPRAEPVKRGLPTFSSLLSTVIWVKNCRSK